ncbi:enoyl-CoA hydratase [Salipaludibacillus keqinensis]|uniref:Enoyl-CoA hydratase n=1 Tax=Salipaludibacillus keqinensis TaxID=2045207 RepID=A0A323TM28_9BACI|nr:enoyl-CoA hydratase [Salipaludibacillus keqinensis]PYZ93693.1 enoyl-CoA hydratase [Salipaludibacillus keqinensis]
MNNFSFIRLETEKRLGIITLNHSPANAISQEMILELEQAIDELIETPEVKVILLRGEGRFFAAGADIKEFTSVKHGQQFREMSREGQRVFRKFELSTKPVLACIHGAALGGGLELAMACHIRLVANDAKLGLPELQLGLIPGFAGTQRLPRLVGKAKATEMMLTSEPVTGEQAVSLGLANQSFPSENFLEKAKEFAHNISEKSAPSLSYVLELVQESEKEQLERGQEKEAVRFGDVFEKRDASEGIKAFMEKRKPLFEDR